MIVGCSIARQSRAPSQEEKQQQERKGVEKLNALSRNLKRGGQARARKRSKRNHFLGASRRSKGEKQSESNSPCIQPLSQQ
jgi:hypothetical protein